MNTKSKFILVLGFFLLGAFMVADNYLSVPKDQRHEEKDEVEVVEVTVSALSPDVSVNLTPDVEASWEVFSDEIKATDGTGVRTSVDGRALITHESAIITSLNNNSEIILSLNKNNKETRLDVLAGQTWSKVSRALEQDEVYEVYTPTMVAAVRGTSFGVNLSERESLIVSEGIVAVSLRNYETDEIIPGTEVLVHAGEVVEVIGGDLKVRNATGSDYDDWYREHAVVFTEAQEVVPVNYVALPTTPSVVPTSPANDTGIVSPEPEPAILTKLKINDVSPSEFYLEDEDWVLIEGEGLEHTEIVLFDGTVVEFRVTNDISLAVRTSEINGSGTYDVEVYDGTESVEIKNAFEVLEPKPEPYVLRVDRAISSGPSDLGVFVFGVGFTEVTAVSVNGDPTDFEILSDTKLELPNDFLVDIDEIEVSGKGKTTTFVL